MDDIPALSLIFAQELEASAAFSVKTDGRQPNKKREAARFPPLRWLVL
ncbi:hypothetical protein [Actinobaculum massiliense]|nr:hypothetical protein [Actinobaculum massiliense]MDK8318880.1 hypothetical protein [Actinobaculum massiliense]MDK8567811.1 hypothetical protein [Actinobaculum massiliense]